MNGQSTLMAGDWRPMPHNMDMFYAIAFISGGFFLAGMLVEAAWFFTGHKWAPETEKALLKFRLITMAQVIPVIAAAWYLC